MAAALALSGVFDGLPRLALHWLFRRQAVHFFEKGVQDDD